MRIRSLSSSLLALSTLAAVAVAVSCSDDAETTTTSTSSAASTSSAGGGATTSATTSSAGGAGGMTGSGGAGGGGATATVDCTPAVGAVPPLKLTSIASGLELPTLVKAAPGDDTRLYVIEQPGRIRIIENGALLEAPFLAIESLVANSGVVGDERGLLGLAFHPDYAANGRFFLHYSDQSTSDTRIAEFKRSADPNVADATPTIVLTQDQPEGNHNGGSIEFSPNDGMLYIGLGDGGGAEDQHGAIGNGQDNTTFLGKLLRIDVAQLPYAIPAGNMTGDGVLPEIWDTGLRNPWRFSFDACTSDLYIGDVGQYEWEEIDVEPAGMGGKNYGWRLMEGTHCFNPSTSCDPGGLTPPVAEYAHSKGCSVSGGYVYRGAAIPGLRGQYLYGDYCSGRVWSFAWTEGAAVTPVDITSDLDSGGKSVVSFGQDNAGEMYLVDLGGTIYRIDAE